MSKNLLVELFVEELPPKALKTLGEAFAQTLAQSLKTQSLTTTDVQVTAYASPRRLAVHVTDVQAQAADKPVSQKLMPVTVGLDADGKPSPALLKKLASLGADESAIPKLKRESDGKAEVLFFDSIIKGASLQEGLQAALDEAIAKLPIPKVMTYQLEDGWTSVNFVRPAHGLVALHGSDVVAVEALGLKADRTTQGHRFEASSPVVSFKDADSYAEQLHTEGAVIASFEKRRDEIKRQLTEAAAKENLRPIDDEALLDEVTALVERPNVLVGQFEQEFLEVPQECLILTMKANQKYFPLLDANGKLTNKFLIVSNINPADASAVIGGNERVVRPRLADAKFFFDQDRKKTLEARVPGLAKVVYHNKLGTQGERTERVRTIARWIAHKVKADEKHADRAALLAKADLLTDMVGEFPELQGIMGGYYARNDNEHVLVAEAIADQYLIRFDSTEASDATNSVSLILRLADRIETLVGIWGIGLKPTGDKDPFALRRHALSVISAFNALGIMKRILSEPMELLLKELIEQTVKTFTVPLLPETQSEVSQFIYERYQNQLSSLYGTNLVDAVITLAPPLNEVIQRVNAAVEFNKLPEAESLAAANKRVGNILKKAEGGIKPEVNKELLKEQAEIALSEALSAVKPKADTAFDQGDYTTSLKALAALKTPVDAFFDNVMVNAEDPALRANRLALLAQLHSAMNRVADLSKLAA